MEGGLESGLGEKGEEGNDAIFSGGGGGVTKLSGLGARPSPPGDDIIMTQACIRPPLVIVLS